MERNNAIKGFDLAPGETVQVQFSGISTTYRRVKRASRFPRSVIVTSHRIVLCSFPGVFQDQPAEVLVTFPRATRLSTDLRRLRARINGAKRYSLRTLGDPLEIDASGLAAIAKADSFLAGSPAPEFTPRRSLRESLRSFLRI